LCLKYSSSLLELVSSFALVSINSDIGTVGGSPEIDIVWIGAVILRIGRPPFCVKIISPVSNSTSSPLVSTIR